MVYGHPKTLLSTDDARAALAAFDRAALLVTPDLAVTHLPFLVESDRLIGHIARANPHWKSAPCDALVVMSGAEAYISPGWYPSKAEHGRAVPTWNYETLQVRGRLTTFDDVARLEDVVAGLSARHEARQPSPWTIAEAPRDYIDRLLGAIVGVEIAIDTVEAKRKLSQDRPAPDHQGVVAGLESSDDARDHAVAKAMRKI
jgi:transcriptional regulator